MSERELEVLFWVVLASLAAVVAATVALVRSGRAVSLPMLRCGGQPHHSAPPAIAPGLGRGRPASARS